MQTTITLKTKLETQTMMGLKRSAADDGRVVWMFWGLFQSIGDVQPSRRSKTHISAFSHVELRLKNMSSSLNQRQFIVFRN